ncbi:MAG: ABC transporter permease, partial [Acidobacteriaceae bacterium]|nr:ABC transporter permease [Acidobacteriaceae bacterium]
MAIAEVPKPGIKPSPRRSSFERTLASARSTMMFSEIAHLAVDSFRANKVRFLLTMLGMIIGSASIILVVTLGLTGKEYAHNLIASIGPNMIEMEYQGGGAVSGTAHTGTPDYMTIDDMHAVLDQVPGIVAASPMRQDHVRISVGGGIVKDATIIGVSPQYKRVRNLRVLAGRFFDDQDARSHTKVAVIVEPFAKLLFGSSQNAVGRSLSVRGIPFTIIGVFKESVETFDQTEVSNQTVLIPYEVSRYFTGTNDLTEIFFTMRDTSLVISAKDKILNIIKSRHKPTSVYTPFTLTEVLNMADKIATMLTIVLTLAAAITLIVSGVGIMNSMLANVSARYREIGIRKALGATGRE